MRKLSFPGPGVGAASLLTIFAVLCLVVFALLSVATVQADTRLGDRSEAAVVGYYQADAQAEQMLAQLRTGKIPDGVSLQDGVYCYSCPISNTQVLAVQVKIEDDDYEILRWQAVSTTQWQPDEELPVWNGGT